ncbi:histone H3 [Anaeramoeba flamelloides]|uniref:Histone H3 n=1 Tax=Anaeramoeba flamelloides TaxID=1746091 RepID=A0AAV7ZE96_9EUKA|nr:histone H3 [Anaeramoeba flamelloides]|eukprot:Anaeramoba_flamelloidesc38711_g1_i2.p1 GENE.c38711_g1_i2~~c38711_g1_i2.p1  ORF type:complete len:180 (+),score=37.71 c38711_g1_i2:22-540(+)
MARTKRSLKQAQVGKSKRGKKGTKGRKGKKGTKGTKTRKGTKGIKGTKGTKGKKGTRGAKGVIKRRKINQGRNALREIKKFQKSIDLLIPKQSFQRTVRSVAIEYRPDIRFGSAALHALQEATENIIIGVLADTNLCAIHAKRVTIMNKDMGIVRRLRRDLPLLSESAPWNN